AMNRDRARRSTTAAHAQSIQLDTHRGARLSIAVAPRNLTGTLRLSTNTFDPFFLFSSYQPRTVQFEPRMKQTLPTHRLPAAEHPQSVRVSTLLHEASKHRQRHRDCRRSAP